MNQTPRWPNRLALLILLLGLTRMAGHLMDNRTLQGLGAASGIAPFPKVFCDSDGYEAFTATCVLSGQKPNGTRQEILLTPERYARLQGPYQRRNAYGAALIFAPRLPENLRQSLLQQQMSPGSPLWHELGLPANWTAACLTIQPRPGQSGPYHYPLSAP
jgi:hypothetical protein